MSTEADADDRARSQLGQKAPDQSLRPKRDRPIVGNDGSANDYGGNYLRAQAIITKLMQRYNEERLHATLG